MARRLRLVYAGAIYHVTFRGNARQDIFQDDADRERLKQRLADSAEDYGVRVYLYCFMSNHVHLLLETGSANVSRFMGSVLTGYTMYYNRRHGQVGHLMQGRFGSQVVEGDEYLLKLSRYIHLNPVQTAAWRNRTLRERKERLRTTAWSSYRAYAGLVAREEWIAYSPIWAMTPGRGRAAVRYARYVEAGLQRPDEAFRDVMAGARLAVGSSEFQEAMAREHERHVGKRARREDVSLRHVRVLEDPETVLGDVCGRLGVERAELARKRRDGTNRGIAAAALVRRSGLTERQAAGVLGLKSGSAVSYLIRMVKNRARVDARVRNELQEVLSA